MRVHLHVLWHQNFGCPDSVVKFPVEPSSAKQAREFLPHRLGRPHDELNGLNQPVELFLWLLSEMPHSSVSQPFTNMRLIAG